MKRRITLIVILVLFLIPVAYFSYKGYQEFQEARRQRILFEKRKTAWFALRQTLENRISQFQGETGILIKDLEMSWEISFNKEKLFPSASLVKIPIMLSCFMAAQEGRLKLEDSLRLKRSYKTGGSGVLKDLSAGSKVTIEELIKLMITDSDNTATNMLIDLLGLDYLNKSFKDLGLKNTNLSRRMLDFKYRKKGVENFTTAEDAAYLLGKFYRKEFINSEISEKCIWFLMQQKKNDRIPAKLPVGTIVAHKTGLERNICHDVGIVYTAKGNFLICVLTKNANNSKSAKEFISEVALDTYNYFQQFLERRPNEKKNLHNSASVNSYFSSFRLYIYPKGA